MHDPFTDLNFSWLNWDALLKRVAFVSRHAADSSAHGLDHCDALLSWGSSWLVKHLAPIRGPYSCLPLA